MKVTVRIHTDHGLEVKTVKVRRGNKLRLAKDWEPVLVDYETKHLAFGRAHFFTDIWEKASETWTFKKGLTPEEQPEMTQEQINHIAKAKIWERRYATEGKQTPTWLMWVILIVSIGGIVFNYLISTGHIR